MEEVKQYIKFPGRSKRSFVVDHQGGFFRRCELPKELENFLMGNNGFFFKDELSNRRMSLGEVAYWNARILVREVLNSLRILTVESENGKFPKDLVAFLLSENGMRKLLAIFNVENFSSGKISLTVRGLDKVDMFDGIILEEIDRGRMVGGKFLTIWLNQQAKIYVIKIYKQKLLEELVIFKRVSL